MLKLLQIKINSINASGWRFWLRPFRAEKTFSLLQQPSKINYKIILFGCCNKEKVRASVMSGSEHIFRSFLAKGPPL